MYLLLIKKYPKYLLYSISHSFTSCLGQTFFISLFIPYMQENITISANDFAVLYSIATFLSAFIISIVGKWIDTMKLNTYSFISISILLVSMIILAISNHFIITMVGLVGIRLSGQSLMSHIHTTSISRYFIKERGTALSISGIGQPIGEAIFPVIIVYMIQQFGWQNSWFSIAIICCAGMFLINQFLLEKGSPFLKTSTEIYNSKENGELGSNTYSIYIQKNWTPKEVIRDPLFYYILPNFFIGPFLLTGFFFFQNQLVEYKLWDISVFASGFIIFGVVRMIVAFSAGYFTDRFSAKNIFPFLSIPLLLGFIFLSISNHTFTIFVYMGLIALDLALGLNVKSALIGELYGIAHIGSIKSIFRTVVVMATGSGTWIFGWLLSNGYQFSHLFAISILTTGIAIILAWIGKVRIIKKLKSS